MKLILFVYQVATLLLSINCQFLFSHDGHGFSKDCFPVHVKKGKPLGIDIWVAEYVHDIETMEFNGVNRTVNVMRDINMTDGESLSVLLYRQRDINKHKTFVGDHGLLKVCNDEAIRRNYCNESGIGHLLWEYKDPAAKHDFVYSAILNSTGRHENVTFVHETSSLCVEVAFNNNNQSAVRVRAGDFREQNSIQNRKREIAMGIVFSLLIIPTVLFIYIWLKWAEFSISKIPFLIKVEILILLFQLLFYAQTGFLEQVPVSYMTMRFLDIFGALSQFVLTFVVFQYSKNFKFEKIQFKSYWVFSTFYISLFFWLIYLLVDLFLSKHWNLSRAFYMSMRPLNKFRSVYFERVRGKIERLVIPLWILIRYYKTANEYHKKNASNDTMLSVFRVWIYCSVYTICFPISDRFLREKMNLALAQIPFIRNTFSIDGEHDDHYIFGSLLTSIIGIIMQFLPLFYGFRPSVYVAQIKDRLAATS